jgi:hypothetical protein
MGRALISRDPLKNRQSSLIIGLFLFALNYLKCSLSAFDKQKVNYGVRLQTELLPNQWVVGRRVAAKADSVTTA